MDDAGEKQFLTIPVIGLDYEYWFSHKFALGLHNELELASYIMEKDHEEHLDREYAIVMALVAVYEPAHGLAFFAGPGYEIEGNLSFMIFMLELEFGKVFEDGWSVGVVLSYDIKPGFGALSTGLTIGKRFGKK
ncbi:hypothetical protein KA005_71775 [bacterium]|nr:hypothetical protein [bacterium]